MLRKIISFIDEKDFDEKGKVVEIPEKAIHFKDDDEDSLAAFNQLKKLRLIHPQKDGVYTEPAVIVKLFKYYSIVKSFDHTIVHNDGY